MVTIRQQLVPAHLAAGVTYRGASRKVGITIHETANISRGADAAAHANLQSRGNSRSASWHYQVDDKEAVQSFPHSARCWHSGAGTSGDGDDTIAIEICVNSDGDYQQAVRNAAELVRQIRANDPSVGRGLWQHNDWSGKNCPTFLRSGSRGISWGEFLAMTSGGTVSGGGGMSAPTPKPVVPSRLTVDGVWGANTTAKLQKVLGLKNIDGTVARQHRGWESRNTGLTSGWQWNGKFDDGGDPVISEMQRRLKVTPDGKVGPKTIRALKRHLGLPALRGTLLRGGLAIKRLQKRLNRGEF